MNKLLMCGAAALMMAMAIPANAATEMKLMKGGYCGTWDTTDVAWGSIKGGQYIFVHWADRSQNEAGGWNNVAGTPILMPVHQNGNYYSNEQLPVEAYYDQAKRYVFRVPYTGRFAIGRSEGSDEEESGPQDYSMVSVCFYNYMVDESQLPPPPDDEEDEGEE